MWAIYFEKMPVTGTEAKTEQGAWNSLLIKVPKLRQHSQNALNTMGYHAKKSRKIEMKEIEPND